jgi:hypothetical protein
VKYIYAAISNTDDNIVVDNWSVTSFHAWRPDWVNFRLFCSCLLWGSFCKFKEVAQILCYFLPRHKLWVKFDKKGWAIFWATFSQTHLVALMPQGGKCFAESNWRNLYFAILLVQRTNFFVWELETNWKPFSVTFFGQEKWPQNNDKAVEAWTGLK